MAPLIDLIPPNCETTATDILAWLDSRSGKNRLYAKAILTNLKEESRILVNEAHQFWRALCTAFDPSASPDELFKTVLEQNSNLYNLGGITSPQGPLNDPLVHIQSSLTLKRHGLIPQKELRGDSIYSITGPLTGPKPRNSLFATSESAIRNLLIARDADRLRDTLGIDNRKWRPETKFAALAAIIIPWRQEVTARIPLAFDHDCLPPFRVPSNPALGYGMTRHLRTDAETVPEVMVQTPVKLAITKQTGKPSRPGEMIQARTVGEITSRAVYTYLQHR